MKIFDLLAYFIFIDVICTQVFGIGSPSHGKRALH
jgi:hypothetical protein